MDQQRPDLDTFAVCVFTASSETVDPAYRVLARQVGVAIADAGWRLVYGGGQVGLMGEVAHAALDAGGGVTGIIPTRLNSREVAFDDIDDLVQVSTLAERKIVMDQRSDAFVVLPGGVGTLDELLEVLTTRHLGYHDKPVLLVDPDGFWDPFHTLLTHMVDHGMLRPATKAMVQTVPGVGEMTTVLTEMARVGAWPTS